MKSVCGRRKRERGVGRAVRKINRKNETQRKKYCKMQIKRMLIMRKNRIKRGLTG